MPPTIAAAAEPAADGPRPGRADEKRPDEAEPDTPQEDRSTEDGPLENGDLDEALEETFPASDPLPPPSTPGHER